MADKENVQPQRRNSVPATLGAFLRRPLAPILSSIPKIVGTNNTEPTVPTKAKVARSASVPSVSAAANKKTINASAELSSKKPLSVKDTPNSAAIPDVAFSLKELEVEVPDVSHGKLQPIQEAEYELERSGPKRPAVWAPVAQPGKKLKSSDGLDFLGAILEEEEPDEKISKRKSNDWLLNFEPYFAESIRLQVALEVSSDGIEPSCSRTMRSILVDWMAMLQKFMRQRPAALHLGVRVFDSILATHKVNSKELQLVALASFWIGSKLDSQNLHVAAPQLLSMCKNAYSQRMLLKAEVSIIKGLDFSLPRDTSHTIVTYQVCQLELTDKQRCEVRHLAGYFLDVMLLNWEAFFVPASTVASAATLCALEILQIAAYRPILCVTLPHTLVSSPSWLELCTLDPTFKPVDLIPKLLAEMMRLMGEVTANDSSFEGIKHKNHLLLGHFGAKLAPNCIAKAYKKFSISQ